MRFFHVKEFPTGRVPAQSLWISDCALPVAFSIARLCRACYLAATCRGGEGGTQTASSRSHPYPPRAGVPHTSGFSFIADFRGRDCPVGLRPDTDSDSGGCGRALSPNVRGL